MVDSKDSSLTKGVGSKSPDSQAPSDPTVFDPLPPLPPLPPQLERYLAGKTPVPEKTPPVPKTVRHSTYIPATNTSYSATLYYPSPPPPPRQYPPYKPYYLVEDDSDMPRQPKHLKKTRPNQRPPFAGQSVGSSSEAEVTSPTNTIKSLPSDSSASINDRFRSFQVIPSKPVVGGDSVHREFFLPYISDCKPLSNTVVAKFRKAIPQYSGRQPLICPYRIQLPPPRTGCPTKRLARSSD